MRLRVDMRLHLSFEKQRMSMAMGVAESAPFVDCARAGTGAGTRAASPARNAFILARMLSIGGDECDEM